MHDVAVVGCGAIGLNTALAIQGALGLSAHVTIFAEKFTPYTTTDIAAGICEPSAKNGRRWAKVTKEHLVDLWRRGEAEAAGISLQPVVGLSDAPDFRLPDWLEDTLGYAVLSRQQLDAYGRNFTGGYVYVTFSWEGSKFLPYLREKFLRNGGQIQQRRVEDLAELAGFDVVVNCSGLGARDLVPDESLVPIRGQVMRVRAPWQYHTIMADSGNDANYVILNQESVVLGRTYQKGDTNLNVEEKDRRKLMKGCFPIVPSLRNAEVVKDAVGLRPGREEVRLELEERLVGGKVMKIVHNYGHGGYGITLSVGCAMEAAGLVKEALGLDKRSKL